MLKTKHRTYHVYRNLTKACWSVRQRGKVILTPGSVILFNTEFRVSEKGRQRVLREQKKYVHAYVAGSTYGVPTCKDTVLQMLFIVVQDKYGSHVEIGYNPYKGPAFVRLDTMEPVTRADVVLCKPDGRTVLAWGAR